MVVLTLIESIHYPHQTLLLSLHLIVPRQELSLTTTALKQCNLERETSHVLVKMQIVLTNHHTITQAVRKRVIWLVFCSSEL